MKAFILAVVLSGLSAFAQTTNPDIGSRFVTPTCTSTSATSCTQTANSAAGNEPTASTPGMRMSGVCAVRIVVSADSGQTLSGAGTMKFHYSGPRLGGRYAENVRVTIPVPAAAASKRDVVLDDVQIMVGYGKLYVEAESVTVSGGAVSVNVETVSCGRGG